MFCELLMIALKDFKYKYASVWVLALGGHMSNIPKLKNNHWQNSEKAHLAEPLGRQTVTLVQ